MPVTANTEFTRPENRLFFPALDGLRGLAFLMVFSQHYSVLSWGWTGVNVFFVLSGFLITGILFDSRDDPHRARNFYLRRTLRIFPLYYGVFLGFILLYPIFHWQWSIAWLAWPLYFGNFLHLFSSSAVPNSPLYFAALGWLPTPLLPKTLFYFGHFWSLCVEEQFYLLWPWVVFRVRSQRALLWICSVAVVTGLLLRLLAAHVHPLWTTHGGPWAITPFQIDALLLGGLLALLWRSPHRKRLLAAGSALVPVAAVGMVLYLALASSSIAAHPAWHYTWVPSFADLFAAALILSCLRSSGLLVNLFSFRPLRWIGRISYGAYVFHDILHNLYLHTSTVLGNRSTFCAAHEHAICAVLALTGTLVLASLSFRFFESPFLNLKERLTLRPQTPSQRHPLPDARA